MIGDITPLMVVAARAIQEREVQRGSNRTISVDVRLIALPTATAERIECWSFFAGISRLNGGENAFFASVGKIFRYWRTIFCGVLPNVTESGEGVLRAGDESRVTTTGRAISVNREENALSSGRWCC